MQRNSRRAFLGTSLGAAAATLAAGSARRLPAQQPAGAPLAGTRTRFAANIEAWWGGMDYEGRIRKAAEFGFPAIEFWPWRGKDIDAIARLTRELHLEVAQFTGWGFEPGMNNPKNHDAVVAEVEESCKVAQRLSCKQVLVVGGNDQPGMTQPEMHQNIITALKRCAPVAEKYGITLILEPMNIRVDHPGHCLYGSEPAVRICRAVQSPHVKICWDLYHCQLSEGDLCGHLKDGADQLGYVQIADTPGRHEPGTGEVHYNRVFQQLWEMGYRGAVGCECWPVEDEAAAARRIAAADAW